MTEATEEQISEELNQALKTNPSKTLHQRISFVGRLGWICFVLMLMAFVLQSIAFSVKPEPILTADPRNGEINGRVLFEDVLVRSDVDVIRDLKAWTSARLSLNSSTIWEDAQIALNHLCSELQEQIYSEWTQTAYLAQIEQTKGVSKVEFNDDEIKLIRPNSKMNLRPLSTVSLRSALSNRYRKASGLNWPGAFCQERKITH